MLTDGGDSVRALAGVMAPGAAPILDWFHIAMRLTGLGQYTKGLAHHNPVEATALESRLERIKWRLWHGDAGEALTRAEQLAADVAALDSGYPKLKRLVKATADLATYIANNAAALPDYSERWLNGERISTAFARVHRQPRGQPALCQETADAVVEAGRPPAPADPNQSSRRHAARPVHHLVSGHGCQRQPSPSSRHCGLSISQALTCSPRPQPWHRSFS